MSPRPSAHQPIPQDDKRTIKGWVRYDWANSVYQLTISSAIFPIYYNQITRNGNDFTVHFFGLPVINTVLYSWAIAAAYLLVAFLSPFLSSIADYTGLRKGFMKGFTWLGAAACSALFFFDKNTIELGVICFALGTVGYGGSLVFYNSFLPIIASPGEQDKVSARGYISGYLGGVVLLIINLIIVMQPGLFGITDPKLPAKLAFLSVGLWWFGFSQTTFRRLPKYTFGHKEKGTSALLGGYRELRSVFNQIRKTQRLKIFLSGYFFVVMGMLTVMFMAATFGEKELHLSDTVLIATILLIQLIGMFGAWFFARLSGRIGNIRAFRLTIYVWIGDIIAAYFITNAVGYLLVGIGVGMVMGGSQSLARSTFSKMLPPTQDHTSFFSFYDVMEKLATVAGTFSFGIIEALTGNMRYSILVIAVFFVFGMGFFFRLLFIEKAEAQQSA
ncbi:MAG: MFS transporter [Candidatus Aminicenantes bacterium]|nr:MFS transporter [Candidatus Aminicenantes bacterium]